MKLSALTILAAFGSVAAQPPATLKENGCPTTGECGQFGWCDNKGKNKKCDKWEKDAIGKGKLTTCPKTATEECKKDDGGGGQEGGATGGNQGVIGAAVECNAKNGCDGGASYVQMWAPASMCSPSSCNFPPNNDLGCVLVLGGVIPSGGCDGDSLFPFSAEDNGGRKLRGDGNDSSMTVHIVPPGETKSVPHQLSPANKGKVVPNPYFDHMPWLHNE
jgi:hypothetical protein